MSFKVFLALLKSDLLILRYNILDKLINLSIYVCVMVLVSQYILPAFGLSQSYGIFMFCGSLAIAGLFEVFPGTMALINDFENEKTIMYQLTLPLSSFWVILRLGIYYAINSFLLMIAMIPLGQILLFGKIDLINLKLFKLLIIILFSSIFYGIFTLWFAGKVKNSSVIGNVWMRYVFPMLQFGGLQFSWKILLSKYPLLAYFDLLNPVIYITEGVRSVVLDSNDYIDFSICLLVISLFTIIFAFSAIYKIKKRLDCI